jgi:hypothetical protein
MHHVKPDNAKVYGAFIAKGFARFKNLMWMHAGDRNPDANLLECTRVLAVHGIGECLRPGEAGGQIAARPFGGEGVDDGALPSRPRRQGCQEFGGSSRGLGGEPVDERRDSRSRNRPLGLNLQPTDRGR